MRVQFRPMPWLSAIVAIMLAILMSLGVWQYQRLQWKTDLLAEVEASVTAPPLTSLKDLERAIATGEPVDFRRIVFESYPAPDRPIYAVYKTQQGGIYWDLFRQYDLIFGKYITVDDSKKPDGKALSPHRFAPGYHVGYVRKNHPMGLIEGWLKPKPNRETNRWFKFNQSWDWGTEPIAGIVGLGGTPDVQPRTDYFVDIESRLPKNTADGGLSAASGLPVRRPSIRNNHRDYMLTWFSFAILLIIFYLLIHRRAGRLQCRSVVVGSHGTHTILAAESAGGAIRLAHPRWADFDNWAALRRENMEYLRPWEPDVSKAGLNRSAYRARLSRLKKLVQQDRAFPFHIFREKMLIGACNITHIERGTAQSARLAY